MDNKAHYIKILLLFSIYALSGCATDSTTTHAIASTTLQKSTKSEVLSKKTPPITKSKKAQMSYPPFATMLPGFKFLRAPANKPTEVSFWITYQPKTYFHVPWYIGGNPFSPQSERIVVDPVNKTISLGFDNSKSKQWSCLKGANSSDRDLTGYSVCSSQFSVFPDSLPVLKQKHRSLWERLFEKPKTYNPSNTVKVHVNEAEIAMVIHQLNLVTRAEDRLRGNKESPKERKHRMRQTLILAEDRFESQLSLLQNTIIDDYKSAPKLRKRVIKRHIMDKSGFYNYDIQWLDPIAIIPHSIKKRRFDYSRFLKEFNKMQITDASQPIVNLLLSRMRQQFDKDRSLLIHYLKSVTRTYGVQCHYSQYQGDYLIKSSCPSSVALVDGSFQLPVKFEILQKKFGTTMPSYNSFNSDLSIQADNSNLKIHNNLSHHSIIIDRIDWMANDVTAKLDDNHIFPIRLGPGESTTLPLQQFLNKAIKKTLKVSWTSRRLALNKAVYYGFDVHYIQGGENNAVSKHLAQKTRYKLSDVLLSQF